MEDTKTKKVYITRNALFKNIPMILCNNILQIDESFYEDNTELFQTECEECGGSGEVKKEDETKEETENSDFEYETCDECCGQGSHDNEFYQYFIASCDKYDSERLKEYGVHIGYSEKLDNYIICIGDFGTGWSAFSYSKEVPEDYTLAHDETETRTTVY